MQAFDMPTLCQNETFFYMDNQKLFRLLVFFNGNMNFRQQHCSADSAG